MSKNSGSVWFATNFRYEIPREMEAKIFVYYEQWLTVGLVALLELMSCQDITPGTVNNI